MRNKKFLRRIWNRYSKLGKGRKKKQKWKKPKGRDNKMREKRKGYPATVKIGYKKSKDVRGKIEGKKVIKVENIKDIKKLSQGDLVIFGKIGKRKKIEMCKEADKIGIRVLNLNIKKFIKKIEENESSKEEKSDKAKPTKEKKEEEKAK